MSIIDLVQSLGIILTSCLAIWQVRAATSAANSDRFMALNRMFLDRPKLWIAMRSTRRDDVASTEDRAQLDFAMAMVFNTLDCYFNQKRFWLVQRAEWAEWEYLIRYYAELPYFEGWWRVHRPEYPGRFGRLVEKISASASASSPRPLPPPPVEGASDGLGRAG